MCEAKYTVMITIRARHLRNMRAGVKRYELRKSRPSRPGPFRVVCCVSGKAGAVEAEFICRGTPELDVCSDARIAELGHLSVDEVRGYRKDGTLFGWRVEDFVDYVAEGHVRHCTDFGVNRPPQSWCYVKEAFSDV